MADIKYVELENLKPQDIEELKQVVNSYIPKFENHTKKLMLKVSVKKRHVLGTIGRFTVKLTIESSEGRFYAEQNGWGLVKTVRRCGEHMKGQLEHKIRNDMLGHKSRKLNR